MKDPTLVNHTDTAILQLEERKAALLTLNIQILSHKLTSTQQVTQLVNKTVAALDKRLDSGDLWDIDHE